MTNTLFYVMGASGAGKDSILAGARARLEHEAYNQPLTSVWFAHRYVTRPADDATENHIALSEREFEARCRAGAFVFDWSSHGLRYGVGIEVQSWLAHTPVVVNGSRAYLETAIARVPELVPVLVDVSPAVRAARLQARGRETDSMQAQRLQRGALYADIDHERLVRISNDGALDAAIDDFCTTVRAPRP
ncbi:MAG: phosphonate metabolism protein/1,5-bisphosphokinase (PRPP-forming) PhnN [Pseudomonadota bacterium]